MKKIYCLLTVVAVMGLTACSTEEYTANCPKGKTAIVYLAHGTADAGRLISEIEARRIAGAEDAVIVIAENGATADITVVDQAGVSSVGSERTTTAISRVLSLRSDSTHSLIYMGNTVGWLPDAAGRMPIKELAAAIPAGAFPTVILSTPYCSGIEVAYELRDKTQYLVSSVGECPGSANITDFIRAALSFDGSRHQPLTIPSHAGEFTGINTSKLPALSAFVRENCDLSAKTDIDEIPSIDEGDNRLFFDFRAYCSSMLKSESKQAELSALLDECIMWSTATDARSADCPQGLCGLTSYIPQANQKALTVQHRQTAWVQSITFGITVNPWYPREIEVEL